MTRQLLAAAAVLCGLMSAAPLAFAKDQGRIVMPPPFLDHWVEAQRKAQNGGPSEAESEVGPLQQLPKANTQPNVPQADAPQSNANAGDEDQPVRPGQRVYIGDVEFRALFEGKTIHVRDMNGVYYGSEQFMRGDRTVWTFRGDTCQDGVWSYTASQQYCFTYGVDGPHCWYTYRDGDKIFVEGVDGLTLEVFDIDSEPVGCQADYIS